MPRIRAETIENGVLFFFGHHFTLGCTYQVESVAATNNPHTNSLTRDGSGIVVLGSHRDAFADVRRIARAAAQAGVIPPAA